MKDWYKSFVQLGMEGEKTITYRSRESACVIESRKRLVPHANRSGGWFCTNFALIRPDGTEKIFWRLQDAKDAAEEAET